MQFILLRGGVTQLYELYRSCLLRRSIGIPDGVRVLLSVGELSRRKNHEVVIRALPRLRDQTVHYAIAGRGKLLDELKGLARKCGVEDRVHFLGFRDDIVELCGIADLFILSSIQEGLPIALMEAIATRTMVVCSTSRGNMDLVKDERCLFDFRSVDGLIQAIHNVEAMREEEKKEIIEDNYSRLLPREKSAVIAQMKEIYKEAEGKAHENTGSWSASG